MTALIIGVVLGAPFILAVLLVATLQIANALTGDRVDNARDEHAEWLGVGGSHGGWL